MERFSRAVGPPEGVAEWKNAFKLNGINAKIQNDGGGHCVRLAFETAQLNKFFSEIKLVQFVGF